MHAWFAWTHGSAATHSRGHASAHGLLHSSADAGGAPSAEVGSRSLFICSHDAAGRTLNALIAAAHLGLARAHSSATGT